MPRAIRRIAALLSAAALIHAVAAPGIAGAPAAMATVSGAESGECDGAGLHADRADHSAPVPGGKQGSRQAPCDGCEVDCLTMAGCTSPALAMAVSAGVVHGRQAPAIAAGPGAFPTRSLAPDRPPPRA